MGLRKDLGNFWKPDPDEDRVDRANGMKEHKRNLRRATKKRRKRKEIGR